MKKLYLLNQINIMIEMDVSGIEPESIGYKPIVLTVELYIPFLPRIELGSIG